MWGRGYRQAEDEAVQEEIKARGMGSAPKARGMGGRGGGRLASVEYRGGFQHDLSSHPYVWPHAPSEFATHTCSKNPI